MTTPTREQMNVVVQALEAMAKTSGSKERASAYASVAAYLKSPPKVDRVDEIVALIKQYEPSSLSLVAHHAWTDGSGESWSVTGGSCRGMSRTLPDALIAAIHEHFKPAPVLVDNAPAGEPVPIVADPGLQRVTVGPGGKPISVPPCNRDEYGVNTATYCAAPALDLATAPLGDKAWVEVVGPSITGAVDRPIGPWFVIRVDVGSQQGFRVREYAQDIYEGGIYPRSSLRGPIPAPKDGQ